MADNRAAARDRIRGLIAAIPTVFDGKGEPDLPMIEKLADFYMNAGVHGFFVLGSQGQGAACRIDQRKAVAEAVVHRVAGRMPVIIQVGTVDPYSAMELGAHASSIGADAIGIVGPYYYNDRNEWELMEHYRLIDQATGLPILLYNNPQYSGYACTPAFMAKLRAAMPNVFGAKLADKGGNVMQASQYVSALSRDFALFGPIIIMVPGMAIGIKGCIAAGVPVTVPEAGVQLIEAIWAGDSERALRLQTLLIEHTNRVAPLRIYGRRTTLEGLRLRGLQVKEYPRWPTKPFSDEHRKFYDESMQMILAELDEISTRAAAE